MPESIHSLQERLAYRFQNQDLLLEALSHPSYTAENDTYIGDNQRLEYLGDAVIELIVTDRIFHEYPDLPEGDMTKMRAILTRRPTLASFAEELCLGEVLRIGRGEDMAGGRERPSNLCDAFEAVIGAIYLDAGQSVEPAAALVNRLISAFCPDLDDLLLRDNPKGMLQEVCQQAFNAKPTYETLLVEGPDHQRTFTVEVKLQETSYGTGQGGRRQEAEQQAAMAALKKLKQEGTATT